MFTNNKVLEEFIQNTSDILLNGIIVIKDGIKIAQHQYEPEIRYNQYSLSKSFTSLAVGIAIDEGLLKITDNVVDFFSDKVPEDPSPNLLKLNIKHLLTMSVGQKEPILMGTMRPFIKEDDWVTYALSQEFVYEPGTKFLYSNIGPYLAGMIVQQLAKCNLVDYLMLRVFEPLEIKRPTWECDRFGNTFGAGGLFLSVSEIAKFGQLYLQNGVWQNKQIVSQKWVQESQKKQIITGEKNIDNTEYGYLFWRTEDRAFRADGKFGQYSIVIPDKNAVIAINAYNRSDKSILDAVWDYLYPYI